MQINQGNTQKAEMCDLLQFRRKRKESAMKKIISAKVLVITSSFFVFGCQAQRPDFEDFRSDLVASDSGEKSLAQNSEKLPALDEKSTLSDYKAAITLDIS